MSNDPNNSPDNAPGQSGAEPVNQSFAEQAIPAEDYDGSPENTPAETSAEATSYRGDFADYGDDWVVITAESADSADSQDTDN